MWPLRGRPGFDIPKSSRNLDSSHGWLDARWIASGLRLQATAKNHVPFTGPCVVVCVCPSASPGIGKKRRTFAARACNRVPLSLSLFLSPGL